MSQISTKVIPVDSSTIIRFMNQRYCSVTVLRAGKAKPGVCLKISDGAITSVAKVTSLMREGKRTRLVLCAVA